MERSKQQDYQIGFEQPITQQPGGWNNPENPPKYNPNQQQPTVSYVDRNAPQDNYRQIDCLTGLEYLGAVDQLLIHQKVELLELITGYETQNKYEVKNSLGQMVYYAAEDSGCCARFCCGTLRPLDMIILDNSMTEVLRFNRPLNCTSCWFPCCLQTMEVIHPISGATIGSIEQNWNIMFPSFNILNEHNEKVLKISGPLITCSCCCNDVVFDVLSADGKATVGAVTKQWSGCCKEAFTDADNFSVTFPLNLDVKVKATLLAAAFLIDYVYYESSGDSGSNGADSACTGLQCILSCL